MNMRTTLMLMAATIAPVYAQQPADSAAQVFTSLATPATATTATAAQRAAAYPSLAHIPGDVEMIFTLNQLGIISELISDATGETDMPWMANLQGFSIAVGKGMLDTMKAIEPILQREVDMPMAGNAVDSVRAIMKKLAKAYEEAGKKAALDALQTAKLPPIYAVLTGTPGSEGVLSNWLDIAVSEMQSDISEDDESELREAVEINGYKGIKVRLRGDMFISTGYQYNEETDKAEEIPLTAEEKAISEAIDKRYFYVLLKQQGNAIVGVICENPEAISIPTKVEDSVLATDKLTAADANLDKSPLLLSWNAPGLSAAINSLQMTPLKTLSRLTSDTFAELAATDTGKAATWKAAADGTIRLTEMVSKMLIPDGKTPDTTQLWMTDGALHVQCDAPANGTSYTPGKLALTAQAEKPSTILYLESTPYTSANLPDGNQLLDAIVNVAEGYAATQNDADAINAQIAMAKMFIPDVKLLCGAFKTIGSGMGNSNAIVVDNAGSMPAFLTGSKESSTSIPRIAFYSGVTDRAKLSEGWQQIITLAGEVAVKVGSDPSVVNMLPIIPTPGKDNTTTFSIALPWFTADLGPAVTVSDTAFAAGSSPAFNAEIAAAATGSVDFAGTVFSIKFDALATTARGIADELQAVAKAESEPLTLGVEGEAPAVVTEDESEESADSTEEEESYIEEEDYEEETDHYVYKAPTPAETRAESSKMIAETCENIAKFAERMDGTCTIAGEQATLRIQLKLKKK